MTAPRFAGSAFDAGNRRVHIALDGAVREHDDVDLLLALLRLLLQHGIDGYRQVRQDARDVGQDAGPVEHPQPQIVGGLHVLHRQDRRVGQLVGLERKMRHAILRIGRVQPRHVDQVGDHGRRRRICARPRAVVHGLPDCIALHQDGVHHALHVGDQPPRRNQRRMHAQLDAAGRAAGDAEQLDPVAQFLGVTDVLTGEPGDALGVGAVELHRDAEADRGEDGELVRGIDAFDVESRIGLRVAAAAAPPAAPLRTLRPSRAFRERMKLLVPLMMPAIHSMRLAVRPSRTALMIGMPPATAASNATITPLRRAAAKISLPCVASSALLAVTTCLPWSIAARIRSLATV